MDIDTPTSLALIADAAERPVSEIQDLNPSLAKVDCAGRIPVAGSQRNRRHSSGGPGYGAGYPSSPLGEFTGVEPGETLAEIAHRYSTPVASLTSANQVLPDGAQAGDLVVIPTAAPAPPTALCRPLLRTTVRPTAGLWPRDRSSQTARTHRSRVTYKTASLTARHHAVCQLTGRLTWPACHAHAATRQKLRSLLLPSEENELF